MQDSIAHLNRAFPIKITMYCKVTIIRENFIFANIFEFDRSRIQHSREMFSYNSIHIRKYNASWI